MKRTQNEETNYKDSKKFRFHIDLLPSDTINIISMHLNKQDSITLVHTNRHLYMESQKDNYK